MIADLNSLIIDNSGLYLVDPADINSNGEIAGQGYDPVTGESPAFLAIACDEKHAGNEGCEDGPGTVALPGETSEHLKVILPERVRRLQQQRRFGRP